MEIKVDRPVKTVENPSAVAILLILVYNLVLAGGACYLVYYKDASAWLFLMALVLAASWKESKKDD